MKLRAAVCLFALTLTPLCSEAFAAPMGPPAQAPALAYGTIASPAADAQLRLMEQKFFEHDCSKEAEEYRLQRLEKFAFGQVGTGNVDQRLARLTQVVDLHPNLIHPKAPEDAPVVAAKPVVRKLDDATAKTPHDQMKWVEGYKPRAAYNDKDRSIVPPESRTPEQRMKDDPEYDEPGQMANPLRISHLPSLEEFNKTPMPDPEVYDAKPPDHQVRMLTRVGWCEQHLFGKTFPQLHLPARLHQLNAEVFPGQEVKNDAQLMDRLDLIVREVVMQQHPPLAYGK